METRSERIWLRWALVSGVGMASLGIFIGWFQGAFLRKWLQRANWVSWWRVSGIVGGLPALAGIFYFLSLPPAPLPTFSNPSPLWEGIGACLSVAATAGGRCGLIAGLIQWLILRKRVPRAGWWVVASVVGWTLGLAVAWLVNWAIPVVLQRFVPIGVGALVGAIVSLLMGGVVLGLITGIVLTWLLKGIPSLPGGGNSLPPPTQG